MSLFDLNRATLIGNVTKDPQLRYTGKGTAVISFSMATNRSMQNEDGSYKDLPTFHNVVAWSKTAERLAKVLGKGKKVYVEGRIENRSYEKDGVTKYISEVVVDNCIVFEKGARAGSGTTINEGSSPAQSSAPKAAPKESAPSAAGDMLEENVDPNDIPF
jgi:single-strand DNA-binding protein